MQRLINHLTFPRSTKMIAAILCESSKGILQVEGDSFIGSKVLLHINPVNAFGRMLQGFRI